MFADVRASFRLAVSVAGLVLATSFAAAVADSVSAPQATSPTPKARIVDAYSQLPLSFEENRGQADKSVKFLSRGGSYELHLAGNEAELMQCRPVSRDAGQGLGRNPDPMPKSSACGVVRMQLAGADSKTDPVGEEQLPGTVNYFIGSDPARWRTKIPTYARVRYPGVYPGIDLVYYGNQGQIEFDFVVAADADPHAIRIRFREAAGLHLAANGDAVATTANGKLSFHKPLIYQFVDGNRRPVAGEFALLGKHSVGFRLGSYDHAKALVIDPALAFSTFLGGTGQVGDARDAAFSMAVDSSQNVYLAGTAFSTDFPVTPGSLQTTNHAAASQQSNVFVTKLNPTGTALVYSTYLGGSGNNCGGDSAFGLALDSHGDAYVTGSACSTDFPITPGAFQTTNRAAANGDANAFVAELNATGTALLYSTYLGGSGLASNSPYGGDAANAISVDALGGAYVTGRTFSTDFPVTSGAYQTTNHAAANGLSNVFITEMNPTGTALVYSTYLGGSGGRPNTGNGDIGNAIALDSSGNAFVVGRTFTDDFPVTSGAFQTTNKDVGNQVTNAFVTKVNPTGSALVYSTYLGGSNGFGDTANAIAVDAAGEAYVAGQAASTDFPVTQGAFQTVNRFGFAGPAGCDGGTASVTGGPNAFITKLNPAGSSLVYSTYLGGSGGAVDYSLTLCRADGEQVYGLAIDGPGNAYVTGFTASGNFPVTQGAYQSVNNDFAGVAGEVGCTDGCIGGYNAFITELNSTGSALVYSTYLGGNALNPKANLPQFCTGDGASALALDSFANVYVAGAACSSDFPVTGGAFQTTIDSPGTAFAARLNFAPTFSITGTAVSVKAGAVSGNTSTVTVTPDHGFTGSVALTAAVTSSPSGAQNPPTLSFGSTSPVDITGPTAGTATLTISTTAAVCALAPQTRDDIPWRTGFEAALACTLFMGALPRRRNWRPALGMVIVLILAGGFLACGSGSGCKDGIGGTTPGTYTITVTGTSGSSTTGTVTLTVQ